MQPPPNLFAPKPAIKPLNRVFIRLIVKILFYCVFYNCFNIYCFLRQLLQIQNIFNVLCFITNIKLQKWRILLSICYITFDKSYIIHRFQYPEKFKVSTNKGYMLKLTANHWFNCLWF